MRKLTVAILLAALCSPAAAPARERVSATNPESAAGYRDLADCERSLGAAGKVHGSAAAQRGTGPRGTLFNRTRGNISRCEMVHGEPQVVVYVKGDDGKRPVR